MRVERKPEIGDTMFHVCEHLYYVPEHAALLNEYCVCEATVVGFLKGGYTEVKMVGKIREASIRPITTRWPRSAARCSLMLAPLQSMPKA